MCLLSGQFQVTVHILLTSFNEVISGQMHLNARTTSHSLFDLIFFDDYWFEVSFPVIASTLVKALVLP